ncbi:YdeI/OmpD-associated family protein [Flavobacterium suncheonense]|uniref:YdeI/OmpD-associated family protein n=1 Tax=Flavobacterium suncheonense TaxID=350894 RepID=UPI0009DC2711
MPAELEVVLKENETAFTFFNSLPNSHKREYIEWISSGKKKETRFSRAEKALTMLLNDSKTRKY